MKASTKYLALSLVAALVALGAGQGEAVPIQWTIASGGNGHSYELFTTPKNFADAQATAIAMGGYLATVTSAAENAFISGTILPLGNNAWIGGFQNHASLSYSEPAGGWEWVTGEPFAYTNWVNISCCHEPGNTGGNEDNLAMSNSPDRVGMWFDINGGAQLGFVVEKDPVADSDGDGIPDNEDDCPHSDLSATVVIDGCHSGVTNTLFPTGCTISDLIAECAAGASDHGQFVSCVSGLTNSLKKSGTITGQQKGAIQSCAANAHIP